MFLLQLILFSSYCVWYCQCKDLETPANAPEVENIFTATLSDTELAREFLIGVPRKIPSEAEAISARLDIRCPTGLFRFKSLNASGPLWTKDNLVSQMPGFVDNTEENYNFRFLIPNEENYVHTCWLGQEYSKKDIETVAYICKYSGEISCHEDGRFAFSRKVSMRGLQTDADKYKKLPEGTRIADARVSLDSNAQESGYVSVKLEYDAPKEFTVNDNADPECKPYTSILLYESGQTSSNPQIKPVLAKKNKEIEKRVLDANEVLYYTFTENEGSMNFLQQLKFLKDNKSPSYRGWNESNGLSVAFAICSCHKTRKECSDYLHATVTIADGVLV